MKVIVVEIFRDRYTNEIHKKGKELKVNSKRYKEIKDFRRDYVRKNKTYKSK